MEKNKVNNKIKKLFNAKARFHKELAKIPIEEKIEMLVKLQEIADDIRAATGRIKTNLRFKI
ncbi:MAG: hypothetical protein WC947_05460 [Elusimicrobiota bacterium]